MKQFRVLLIVPLCTVGGTELATLSLATGLKQAGHEVYVMVNPHPLTEEFAARGLTLIPATMKRSPAGVIKDAGTMRRCISEKGVEIVHFQSAFPIIISLLAWRTIKSRGVKLVWTSRGMRKLSYRLAGHTFNHILDFAIANCDAERDKLISNGLSPRKIRAIYNCPNVAVPREVGGKSTELLGELGMSSDVPIVGTASRLTSERGVKYFVEAAAAIHNEFPRARFIVAGSGPLEEELRQRSREMNVEQVLLFLGARRDMERVYSIMDVFVNPLVPFYGVAGTGNTTIEAMAFAKPVVATNVAGIPEAVLDGVTGLLVPPQDAARLAEATMRLLRDKDLARRMGMAGRERILKEFTMEGLVREIEEVYSITVEGAGEYN